MMTKAAIVFCLLLLARVSAQSTCDEVKKVYRADACCGMPSKHSSVVLTPVMKAPYSVVETPTKYMDGNAELHGLLIHQAWSTGSPTRPGLVLYGGPWGDGGGAAEREYAKVYAAKGMVVFLPDYYPDTCGDTNQTTLMICLQKYPKLTTADAQRIALLAVTTLKNNAMVDSTKVGAIGFCFGGSMALEAARAGATFEVAVALHAEYRVASPASAGATPKSWSTKMFVEMIGYDDPLIPQASRELWLHELNNATKGTTNTAEVDILMNTVHAFSIQYSSTFINILNGQIPGVLRYSRSVAMRVFDKIDYLFARHGLINARTHPANPALGAPRSEFGEES